MAQLGFQPGRRASLHLFPALYADSSSVTTETGGASMIYHASLYVSQNRLKYIGYYSWFINIYIELYRYISIYKIYQLQLDISSYNCVYDQETLRWWGTFAHHKTAPEGVRHHQMCSMGTFATESCIFCHRKKHGENMTECLDNPEDWWVKMEM
jgi:hypothetical protein